jgi:hypothetical protein
MSIAPKNKLWTAEHAKTALDHFKAAGYSPQALDLLQTEFKRLVDAAEREGMAGDQPLPFAADQLFLALVDVIAAQIADAATGSGGQSLFTAELALLRRLQAELPTMIEVAEKAERVEREGRGPARREHG